MSGGYLEPKTNPFSQFLRLAFVRSPNYVTGSTGWTINQDGSVEFNNGTFRGTVTASTFQGTDFIINSSGIFMYSGTPANNNLIGSWCPVAANDPFGTACPQGISLEDQAGLNTLLNGATLALTKNSGAHAAPIITLTDNVTGFGSVYATDHLSVLNAELQNVVATPNNPGGVALLFGTGGQPAWVNPAGLQARMVGARLGTVNTNTVTAAALSNLFNDTIPAGDAGTGSVYRARAWGFGTWGSTQQALTFAARFGSTAATVIGTTPQIAATALAASAAFEWEVTAELVCVTSGASATWRANIKGTVTQTANAILPGTAADNTIAFTGGTSSDLTLDSTVNEAFGLSAAWASTTGAPTLTKTFGQLYRIS